MAALDLTLWIQFNAGGDTVRAGIWESMSGVFRGNQKRPVRILLRPQGRGDGPHRKLPAITAKCARMTAREHWHAGRQVPEQAIPASSCRHNDLRRPDQRGQASFDQF